MSQFLVKRGFPDPEPSCGLSHGKTGCNVEACLSQTVGGNEPGDPIFTGTPEDVGPVRAGDRIDGRIEEGGSIVLNAGAAE